MICGRAQCESGTSGNEAGPAADTVPDKAKIKQSRIGRNIPDLLKLNISPLLIQVRKNQKTCIFNYLFST
jgi:hypothetical protein